MTDQLPATTQPQRASITTGGTVGALIPRDIEQAFRIAQALAQSGMTPNGFKTPETCFVAIMAGAELGLPPFQSLQSFAIINGRPTLYGDALMAVIRTNGFKVREWFEGEGDTLTAFCEITRPDNGDTAEASFSVEDAKTAKLWNKGGPWSTNPKRMLQWRARSFAARDGAADVLRGLSIREEVEDYDTAALPVEEKRAGTGLLAKLTATQTLAEEGFGVRDLDKEVADPPKPKRTPRKAKASDLGSEMLDAIAEAEPEIVAQVVEDHGEPTAGERMTEQMQNPPEGFVYVSGDEKAPETPTDAQVEEAATYTAPEPETVADGHAEPGEGYFLGEKAAFQSGRRVWYVDGVEQKDTADDGTLPVYAEHAPLAIVQNEVQTPDPDSAETIAIPAETPDLPGFDDGAQLDPFATFEAALTAAKSWPDLRPAVVDLSKTPEWRARPHDQKRVRLDLWGLVQTWNDAGAKLDPVDDPFLFQAFVTAEEDVEAIEGTLALVQDSDWFKAASPEMQAGVGRFVMSRTQQIRGA